MLKVLHSSQRLRPNSLGLAFVLVSLMPHLVFASAYPIGEAMSTGMASSGISPNYIGQNPATSAAIPEASQDFSWELFNVGLVIEAGPVETLSDQWDEIGLDNVSLENFSQVSEDLNTFLGNVGHKAYANFQLDAYLLSPVSIPLSSGAELSFNAKASAELYISLLGGSVTINQAKLAEILLANFTNSPPTIEGEQAENELTQADYLDVLRITSAIYAKTKKSLDFSISYAQQVHKDRSGRLVLGGTANLHQLSLSKGVLPLKTYLLQQANHDENPEAYPDDAQTLLEEDIRNFNQNEINVQTVTFDIGATWYARHYDFGLLIKNINQPSVSFPRLGFDCEVSYNPSNCYYALALASQIDLREKYFYSLQPRAEAHVFTEDRAWTLGAYYEIWPEDQPLAYSTQWTGVSMNYTKPVTGDNWYYRWLIPNARLGFHQNLAGSGYSYYGVGLSLLGFKLDVMIDNNLLKRLLHGTDDIPHIAGGSFGWSISF